VNDRSSAWFGARCRLVYFIIHFNRQAPGQARLAKLSAERSAGTVFFFSFPPNTANQPGGFLRRLH
jgi:hypothetical protein